MNNFVDSTFLIKELEKIQSEEAPGEEIPWLEPIINFLKEGNLGLAILACQSKKDKIMECPRIFGLIQGLGFFKTYEDLARELYFQLEKKAKVKQK